MTYSTTVSDRVSPAVAVKQTWNSSPGTLLLDGLSQHPTSMLVTTSGILSQEGYCKRFNTKSHVSQVIPCDPPQKKPPAIRGLFWILGDAKASLARHHLLVPLLAGSSGLPKRSIFQVNGIGPTCMCILYIIYIYSCILRIRMYTYNCIHTYSEQIRPGRT